MTMTNAELMGKLLKEAAWNRDLAAAQVISVISEEHSRLALLLEQAAAAIPVEAEPVAEIVEAKEYKTKAIMFLDSFEGLPVGTKLYASPRITMPENVRKSLSTLDYQRYKVGIKYPDGSGTTLFSTSDFDTIRAFLREVTTG